MAILNGGYAGWERQGYAVASGPLEAPQATPFEGELDNALLATTEEVEAAREAGRPLVDARPPGFFTGEIQSPAPRVPGTIPGAVNLPHDNALVMRDGAYYLDRDRLKASIDALELDHQAPTLVFCNTGHWAASGWFQLSEVAGLAQAALYDGSMAEWTQDDARPVQSADRGVVTVGELLR